MENKVILELRNISKTFGKNTVLKGIDLAIREGVVMGLMGENGAGKSTMMKILFGIYSKDDGQIILNGKEVTFSGPKEALENGVAMVHQELNQCLERNIKDNLFLGRYPKGFGMIDEKRMEAEAQRLFKKLGINVNLKVPMKTMSVANRQMVEIAKAVSYDAKLIVLDEPTSSLTDKEVKKLFSIIRELKKEGVSFVYISHKMDEIFEICDEISVLRDGQMIMTKAAKDTDMNELISAMVGRSLDHRFPPVDNVPGEDLLVLENVSTKYEPFLKDISLTVKKGEILGLYGLVGAGRSELLETLFGLRQLSGGVIRYEGEVVDFKNSEEAMERGFAFVTEERKYNGLYLKGDLTFNTCINNMKAYRKGFALNERLMREATNGEIRRMRVKCMGTQDLISALSGGNQQKVIIGKWLERDPDVFLLAEPTRGIAVGAKYELYQLIIDMAKKGKTCIVVSSEMPEILGITNRIAVMSNHRLSGVVDTKSTDQEELLRLSAKYL